MNVIPHDFTRPTPLSVHWHQRLTRWCQVAQTLANKSWTKHLPAPLEVLVQGIELCFARQALARLTDDTLVYRIKLGDQLNSILILPRTLMLNLVGTLLGDKASIVDRELTLIEEKLGDYFLTQHWLAYFREAWPGAAGASWLLNGRELNLPCSRLYADTDVLLTVNWQMRGAWGETQGAWFFPKRELLDLVGNHPTAHEPIPEAQVNARREAIVQYLPISVEVVLGSAELRLSELSSLQVGDVVLLDQRATDGVVARIGDMDLYRGQAGRLGSWKAFQVETNVKK